MGKVFIFFLILSQTLVQSEKTISGKVISVIDGNTIEISAEKNKNDRVVLLGIDCPEMTQAYGEEAKKHLEKWLLHREVVVHIHGKDRFKNYIGVVLLKGLRDVRFDLLEQGLAWSAEKNPLPELESVRLQAEKKKRGLWEQKTPTPPWVYRRQQSMLVPKSR